MFPSCQKSVHDADWRENFKFSNWRKVLTFFSILMKISVDDIPTKTDMSDAILI